MDKPRYDTKIVFVLDQGLETWQKLNVTAFLASAVAKRFPETLARDFVDASGVTYPGVFRQPVIALSANREQIRTVFEKARARELDFAVYTEPLFRTMGEEPNRAAVAACREDEHVLVGLALHGKKNLIDRITKGLKLHP